MSDFNPALYLRKLGELRRQEEPPQDLSVCAFCSRAHMELGGDGRCWVCKSDQDEEKK